MDPKKPDPAANSFQHKLTRYLKYNEERKAKAMLFNAHQGNLLLKVLPYLLHSNYPDLPGFIDDADCPHGIHLFNPAEELPHELFRRYFPLGGRKKAEEAEAAEAARRKRRAPELEDSPGPSGALCPVPGRVRVS